MPSSRTDPCGYCLRETWWSPWSKSSSWTALRRLMDAGPTCTLLMGPALPFNSLLMSSSTVFIFMTASPPAMPWFEARLHIMGGERWLMGTAFPFLVRATFGLTTILSAIALTASSMLLWARLLLQSPTTISRITMRWIHKLNPPLVALNEDKTVIIKWEIAEVICYLWKQVMLLGHSDSYVRDKSMQVTIAYNHFGEGLIQRMPRHWLFRWIFLLTCAPESCHLWLIANLIWSAQFFRCRHGYFHVVNNDYTHWEMYAIGGSAEPTINSQGNRYLAPLNPSAKEVTKLETNCTINAFKWSHCSPKSRLWITKNILYQVTKRVDTSTSVWKSWNWRSSGDLMLNGAFFTPSGAGAGVSYARASSLGAKSSSSVGTLTSNAGVLVCRWGRAC